MENHGEAEHGRVAPDPSWNSAEVPVAAPADVEAWKARKAYPCTLCAGGPVFGVARERAEGGWELRPGLAELSPQDARDALAAHLRDRAGRGGPGSAECAAAAERLDWEALDELMVAGGRYRIVRAERFIRMGPDGPEPPRAGDPDRAAAGQPPLDPAAGLVIGAPGEADPSAGVLRVELLTALRRNGAVPRDVREDSDAAALTHPCGALLPATFMAAEREGGRWRPQSTGTDATPRDARDGLAVHLRVMVPWQKDLTDGELDLHLRAADRLDTEQCDELDVAGRHFRIVRVERLIRMGLDGPEAPRPSDPDPLPPPNLQDDPPPDDAPEPDASTAKFLALFEAEHHRRHHATETP